MRACIPARMFARIDYDFFTVASVCASANLSLGAAPLRLTSITNSSLEVTKGSLFVPLVDKRDGHGFIEDALAKGAAAFFLQRGHSIARRLSQSALARAIIVDDPLLALGKLAHFHRMRFAPFVVAVTGSNGKTTTKEMLAQIFRQAFGNKCIATEKNYNNHIGLPFTLFAIQRNTRVAILEMGMNHAGEIAYLSRLARPHAAVVSSVGHAHIEFFKSRAGIAKAKAEVLEGMNAGGTLYVPHDIAELKTLVAIAERHKTAVHRVNPQKGAALRIVAATAQGFALKIKNQTLHFPFANRAWLSNLALAAQVAIDVGVAADAIASAAKKFRPAAGRMQPKRLQIRAQKIATHRTFRSLIKTFTLIDDGYNANPDSAVASIDAALQIADGKPVVCVFGDFKELGAFGKKLHAWTGREAAQRGISAFYGVGDAMRDAVTAFKSRGNSSARSYAFKRSEVDAIVAQLCAENNGTVILVKGSRSMQMEEIVAALSAHAVK